MGTHFGIFSKESSENDVEYFRLVFLLTNGFPIYSSSSSSLERVNVVLSFPVQVKLIP